MVWHSSRCTPRRTLLGSTGSHLSGVANEHAPRAGGSNKAVVHLPAFSSHGCVTQPWMPSPAPVRTAESENEPMSTNHLDVDQHKAAHQAFDVPVAIVAPAGSGKTRTLLARLQAIVERCHISVSRILVVTFSRKAADELRTRIISLTCVSSRDSNNIAPQSEHQEPSFFPAVSGKKNHIPAYTFHAFALALLRRYGDRIGYNPEQITLLERMHMVQLLRKEVIPCYQCQVHDLSIDRAQRIGGPAMHLEDPHACEKISRYILSRKDRGLAPDVTTGNVFDIIHALYESIRAGKNWLDFGDLVPLATRILKECKDVRESVHQYFPYVLVDEFQDVNHVQICFLRALIPQADGESRNVLVPQRITVVGDANQSIYGFRGALSNSFIHFTQHFDSRVVHHLQTNYRSTQAIIDFAQAVLHAPLSPVEHSAPLRPEVGPQDAMSGSLNHQELRTSELTPHPVRCVQTGGILPTVHIVDSQMDEAETVMLFVSRAIKSGAYQPRDIAILSRIGTHILPPLVALLKQYNIPVVSCTSRLERHLMARSSVQIVVAYTRMALMDDDVAFEMTYNFPRRGLGEQCLRYIQQCQQSLRLPSLYATLQLCAKAGFPRNPNPGHENPKRSTTSAPMAFPLSWKPNKRQAAAFAQYVETINTLREKFSMQQNSSPFSSAQHSSANSSSLEQWLRTVAKTCGYQISTDQDGVPGTSNALMPRRRMQGGSVKRIREYEGQTGAVASSGYNAADTVLKQGEEHELHGIKGLEALFGAARTWYSRRVPAAGATTILTASEIVEFLDQTVTINMEDDEDPVWFTTEADRVEEGNCSHDPHTSNREKKHEGFVTVTTIHQAKGLEWPVVFLLRCNEGCMPCGGASELQEERRLMYVATTRAARELHITVCQHDEQDAGPSRFLLSIPFQLYTIRDWSKSADARWQASNSKMPTVDVRNRTASTHSTCLP